MKRWFAAVLALVLAVAGTPAVSLSALSEGIDGIEGLEGPVSEQVGLMIGDDPGDANASPDIPDTDISESIAEETVESEGALADGDTSGAGDSKLRKDIGESAVAAIEVGDGTGEAIEPHIAEADLNDEAFSEEALGAAASNKPIMIEMPDTYTMGVDQTSAALEAYFIYEDGQSESASGLTWSSSNTKIVTVKSSTGKLTAKKKGKATITAKTKAGLKATCTVTVKSKPSKITVKPSSLKLGAGGMVYPLTVSLAGSGVTFTSSNPKVAKVDSNGVITAIKKGSAVITARTYNNKTATCEVSVYAAPGKVTLAKTRISMAPGKETVISATAKTASGGKSAANFTYYINDDSPDPDCIVLDEHTGRITSLFAGEALVTAMTHNGIFAICRVQVTSASTLKAIALPESAYMTVGDTLDRLEAKALYKNGQSETATGLTWSSSNTKVVTVNASTGKLTAKKSGTATITAKTSSGLSAQCKVTVGASDIVIKLEDSQIELGVGEAYTLDGTITVPNGYKPTITWNTSNASVATVDQNGRVTANAVGTAIITVYVGSAQSSCHVTVKESPSSITITPAKGTITVGTSGKYSVSLPSGSAGAYTFKSSNTSIVSVDKNGIVTGHKVGQVTITVTTYNNRSAKSTLTVKSATGGGDYTPDEGKSDSTSSNSDIETVIRAAESQMGMPYIYGAGYKDENPRGFDCSGLVYWAFYQVGIKLKDSSGKQGSDDTYPKIGSIDALKRGDYVCFKSDRGSSTTTTHTGIYLGNGVFIHASSSAKKVIKSSFYEGDSANYWTDVFLWGRRVIS